MVKARMCRENVRWGRDCVRLSGDTEFENQSKGFPFLLLAHPPAVLADRRVPFVSSIKS